MSWGLDIEFGGGGFITRIADVSFTRTPAETKRAPIALAVAEPTLQGFATKYLKPHVYGDGIDAFMPGCFASSLMSGKSIRLLVQHAGIGLLGTVRDRLELLEDDDGLAFRYELADTAHAKEIARLVEAGQLAEMSIGYKVLRHEIKTIEGSSVRLIREGDLDEISIVGRGAVPGTHCRLVDGRKRSTLREELKSGTLTEPDAIDGRSKSETAWQRLIANLRRAQDVLE